MTRFAMLGLLAAFALAAPLGMDAAHAKKAVACAAKTMEGKQTKWKCKADQKCCFNWLQAKGGCVAKSDVCL